MEQADTKITDHSPFPANDKRNASFKTERDLIPNASWQAKIHPADRIRVLSTLKKVLERFGRKWEDEYRFKTPGGNYALIHDSRWITYDHALCPLSMKGVVEEIADGAEILLFKYSQQIALNRFSATTIRNLRNPLEAVCLATELLIVGKLSDEQNECVNIINRAAQKINDFINTALVPYMANS